MVISDIHGSASAFTAALNRYKREEATHLLIAGDITARYSERLTESLNTFRDHITAVHGNCDSIWDQNILQFPIPMYRKIPFLDHTVFLTHGNHFSPKHPPLLEPGDIFVSGHTHRPALEYDRTTSLYLMNPGSIATPRGGSKPSYGLITADALEIKELHTSHMISRLAYNFS